MPREKSNIERYLDKLKNREIKFTDIEGARIASKYDDPNCPMYILDTNCAIEVIKTYNIVRVTNVVNNQYVETEHTIN